MKRLLYEYCRLKKYAYIFEIISHNKSVVQSGRYIDMMKANKSIQCTVSSCKHHCNNENYCSLDCIMVGTHECNPTMDQCTDCKSFDLKQ